MVDDEIRRLRPCPLTIDVKLIFVQSQYIYGGFGPSLSDCCNMNGTFAFKHNRNYNAVRRRSFRIAWKRADQRKKQSFVLIHACDDHNKDALCVAQVLIQFSLTALCQQLLGNTSLPDLWTSPGLCRESTGHCSVCVYAWKLAAVSIELWIYKKSSGLTILKSTNGLGKYLSLQLKGQFIARV